MSDIQIIQLRPYQLPGPELRSVGHCSAPSTGTRCMTTHEIGHDAASSEGTVSVTEADTGTYTQQITAGHHRLVADEPQLATTQGQHPTICSWPRSGHVPR
jgi:hypothetical protein